MNINEHAIKAQQNFKKWLERDAQVVKTEVRRSFVNQVIPMVIRDREHFYKVVNWCNKNIGKGKQYWTVGGRVLRFVDPSKKAYSPPAHRDWLIMVPGIDCTAIKEM